MFIDFFYVYVQKRQSNVSPQTTVFQSLSKSYSNLDINQSSVPMKKVIKFSYLMLFTFYLLVYKYFF